jgi:membrane-bound metal-dependent hydrolase YbcI (DUF457 family)
MSWSAHEFELYVVQKHLGSRVSMFPLLLGNYSADALTKCFVYGIEVGPIKLVAKDPAQFHRGWPGAGFTHSLLFGVVLALLVYWITRSRVWGLSVLVAQWIQSITDIADSVGTMLFWPFTTEHINLGVWRYAAQAGRYDDAGAYYSSLGFVMDAVWLVIALAGWRVLTADYFRTVVLPNDPVVLRIAKRVPEKAILIFYRAAFFYGVTRLFSWTIWRTCSTTSSGT